MKKFIDIKSKDLKEILLGLCHVNEQIEFAKAKATGKQTGYIDILNAIQYDLLTLIDDNFVDDEAKEEEPTLVFTLKCLEELEEVR